MEVSISCNLNNYQYREIWDVSDNGTSKYPCIVEYLRFYNKAFKKFSPQIMHKYIPMLKSWKSRMQKLLWT